ncbi:MAG: hypothetical protein ABS904_01005 [Solibacillus isronensis]
MTNGTMHITLRDAKKLKQYLNGELLEINLFEQKGINLQVSLTDVHMPTDEEFVALGFLPHADKVLLKRGGLELPKLLSTKTAERTATVGDTFSKLKKLTNATIYPAPPISDKKMNKMKNLLRTVLMHPAHNGNLDDLFEIIKELDADMKQGMDEVKEILSQYDEPSDIDYSALQTGEIKVGDPLSEIEKIETENQRRRREREAQFAEEVLNLGGSLPDNKTIHEIVTTNPFQELDEAEAKFAKMPESEDEGWMLYHSEPPCIYCDKPVINSDEYDLKHDCFVHEVCVVERLKQVNDLKLDIDLEEDLKLREIFANFTSKKTPSKALIETVKDVTILTDAFKDRFKGMHINLLVKTITEKGLKTLYLIHNGHNMAVVDLLFRKDKMIELKVSASTELKKYTNTLLPFVSDEQYQTTIHTYVNKDMNYIEDIFRYLYRIFFDHEGMIVFDDLPPKLELRSKEDDDNYLLEIIK